MRKIVLFPTIFILLSILSYANYEYTEVGTPDFNFVLNNSLFTTSLTDYTVSTRNLGRASFIPLVKDLDGDGVNEIVVLDGSTIRLYQYVDDSLTILTSADLPHATVTNGYMSIHNMDDDAYFEILFAQDGVNNITFYEYNGTHLYSEYEVETNINPAAASNFFLCDDDTKKCIITSNNRAQGFNATQTGDALATHNHAGTTRCHSGIKGGYVGDFDDDGTKEYIFSWVQLQAGDDTVIVMSFELESNLTVTNEAGDINTYLIGKGIYNPFDSGNCQSNQGRVITAPLVHDFDVGGTKEIVIGYMVNANHFQLSMFKANGLLVDDSPFPQIDNGEGLLVSNPILADVFPDTGREDFCVMGYDNSIYQLDIVCGSIATGYSPQTNEYTLDIQEYGNITNTFGLNRYMIHAVQVDSSYGDEILTAYGTIQLDYDSLDISCNLAGECDANLLWEMPDTQKDGSVISVDVQKVGTSDLIVMTSENLWYIDSGFTNSGADIDDYYINPCIDSTWKVNTSLEVRITPKDVDGNQVQARAILFYGESYAQDKNWSGSYASGVPITISDFDVNITTPSATLRLMARDTGNPTDTDIIDLPISVNTNGVVFGDCTTTVEGLIEAEAENETASANNPSSDNAIEEAFDLMAGQSGLGNTVLWLLVMTAAGIGIWYYGSSETPQFTIGAFMIIESLLFVMGVKLGFFGVGTLLVVVILGIIAISISFRKSVAGA